ncbi:MAG TPA: hypothetical protein PLQ98_00115 [Bacillota bacterium]|nr:hypothetical protein [Bacillota bacterium]
MQVSLKKGAALALALSAIPVKLDHTYSIDVFGSPPAPQDIEDMGLMLTAQLNEALRINQAVFTIRSMIGQKNEGQINNLLTERAMIDKSLAIVGGLPLRSSTPNLATLPDKMALAKEQASSNTFRSMIGQKNDGKTLTLLIELRTDTYVPISKALKKRRLKIEDELAHLNFTTMIELPEDVVAVLTAYDLI